MRTWESLIVEGFFFKVTHKCGVNIVHIWKNPVFKEQALLFCQVIAVIYVQNIWKWDKKGEKEIFTHQIFWCVILHF